MQQANRLIISLVVVMIVLIAIPIMMLPYTIMQNDTNERYLEYLAEADAVIDDATIQRLVVNANITMANNTTIRNAEGVNNVYRLSSWNGTDYVDVAFIRGGNITIAASGNITPAGDDVHSLGSVQNGWDIMHFAEDLSISGHPTDTTLFRFMNGAATGYAKLKVGTTQFSNLMEGDLTAVISPTNLDNSWINLQARNNGVGREDIARLASGADPLFSINAVQAAAPSNLTLPDGFVSFRWHTGNATLTAHINDSGTIRSYKIN